MNKYDVLLINKDGCMFDRSIFTNLKKAKSWACKRAATNDKYKVVINKNGIDFKEYYTR